MHAINCHVLGILSQVFSSGLLCSIRHEFGELQNSWGWISIMQLPTREPRPIWDPGNILNGVRGCKIVKHRRYVYFFGVSRHVKLSQVETEIE